MFRVNKFINFFKYPSSFKRNIFHIDNKINPMINLAKKNFFKKSNILCLAAKKDYYSKHNSEFFL